MTFLRSFLVRMQPKSKRIIATVGDVALVEHVWAFDEVDERMLHELTISHRHLLPPHTTSEYIPISEAHAETGLSESTIRRLAQSNIIDAIKVNRKWLVLRESLYEYIGTI